MELPLFIAVEGVDGAGKTTVCELLRELFLTYDERLVNPGSVLSSTLGKRVRQFINDGTISKLSLDGQATLMAGSILDYVNEKVLPSLDYGTSVVSDRYTLSTQVYQNGSSIVDDLVDIVNSRLTPDITIVIDVPAHVAYDRVRQRAIDNGSLVDIFEQVSLEEINKRSELFIELAPPDAFIIDGTGDIDNVRLQLEQFIIPLLN